MSIVAQTQPTFLTAHEFHQAFEGKVGLASIYEAMRTGEIKHVRLGRKLLILASEVRDWPLRMAKGGSEVGP